MPHDLVAFYDEVAASVAKGRTVNKTDLDFCKAFNVVPRNILADRLARYRFDVWTVR